MHKPGGFFVGTKFYRSHAFTDQSSAFGLGERGCLDEDDIEFCSALLHTPSPYRIDIILFVLPLGDNEQYYDPSVCLSVPYSTMVHLGLLLR